MLNPLQIVYALEMKKTSRAPYGARGLKYIRVVGLLVEVGRAPYGARGLKFRRGAGGNCARLSRAPYGARGLKFALTEVNTLGHNVAPRMGRVD